MLLYTENAEQSLHIVRNFAFEPAIFTINGMNETNHRSVQCLSVKAQILQTLAMGRSCPAIDRVAKQGVAY